MVLIAPPPEKADPPPYTPTDPSLLAHQQPSTSTPASPCPPPPPAAAAPPLPTRTSSDGSSRPLRNVNPVQPTAKNYLRLVQVDQDIIGHWTINPALHVNETPPSQPAPSANVYFQTEGGKIEASVAWVTGSTAGEMLPRAKVEAMNKRGDISITNTVRPRGLPIHVKATALKKGDVRVCAPSDFYGILLLRIPSTTTDWKTRIGLASVIKSQISCTRETAITRKGKNKLLQQSLLMDPDSDDHTLVEILIGPDLEVQDFNRAFNAAAGSALDLIEVEIRGDGTRIMILSAEDAALGNEPFLSQQEGDMSRGAGDNKTWKVPGSQSGGFTVSFRDRANRPANHSGGIEIVIDEPPKWVGSIMKMWGKDKDKEGKEKEGKKLSKTGASGLTAGVSQGWGWITSPQSSTVTLVTPDERPTPPAFTDVATNSTGGGASTLSPRSSYLDHHRRHSSSSHDDHSNHLATPPPSFRSQRSASFGGSSEAPIMMSPPLGTSPALPPPHRQPTPQRQPASPPALNLSTRPASPYMQPASPPPQHPSRSPSDPKMGPRHPDLARPLLSPQDAQGVEPGKRVPFSRHGHSYSMDDLRDAIDDAGKGRDEPELIAREQSASPTEMMGGGGNYYDSPQGFGFGSMGRHGAQHRMRQWQEQVQRVGANFSFGRDMGPYRFPHGTMPLPSASTAGGGGGGQTRGRWDPDFARERWNSSRHHMHWSRGAPPPAQPPRPSPPRATRPPTSPTRGFGPSTSPTRGMNLQRPPTSPSAAYNHQRGASNPWPASSSSPPPVSSSSPSSWQQRAATIPQPSSPSPSSNSNASARSADSGSSKRGRNKLVKVKMRNQSTPDLRGGDAGSGSGSGSSGCGVLRKGKC